MAKDIVVYFKNHCSVRYCKDDVVFVNDAETGKFRVAVDDGKAVINWANVSWVREYRERKEDTLDDAD